MDELEGRFDSLLNTATDGPAGECHCANCKPHEKRPERTWTDNITAPGWCAKTACKNLGATWSTEPLIDEMNDGTEGSCNKDGKLWVRPNATIPLKVIAHELGHHTLGHGVYLNTPAAGRYLQFFEMEAESTAMLVADALGLADAVPVARGYIKVAWKKAIPPKSMERIKVAARKIIEAGRVKESADARNDANVGEGGDSAGDHPAPVTVGDA